MPELFIVLQERSAPFLQKLRTQVDCMATLNLPNTTSNCGYAVCFVHVSKKCFVLSSLLLYCRMAVNYYELLGVKSDATLDEIKNAFFDKSKKVGYSSLMNQPYIYLLIYFGTSSLVSLSGHMRAAFHIQ